MALFSECSVVHPVLHYAVAAGWTRPFPEDVLRLRQRKAALEALFKTLLHHLMTGKMRVPSDFIRRFQEEDHESQ